MCGVRLERKEWLEMYLYLYVTLMENVLKTFMCFVSLFY
jgi:hypothetical protein